VCLKPGYEAAVDENGNATYHYYVDKDGDPATSSAGSRKLEEKTTRERPRKVLWRSPKHIADALAIPAGWEETVVDGQPFYQYYVNKSGQPWPRNQKDDDGTKKKSGKGRPTRPEILTVDDILKEGYELKGGDYVLPEERRVWRCKDFKYDYCQTCFTAEPKPVEWHGDYTRLDDGNYQGPGKWKLYKEDDSMSLDCAADQEDIWWLSQENADAFDGDSIILDGFDPHKSKTVKTADWKLARFERT